MSWEQQYEGIATRQFFIFSLDTQVAQYGFYTRYFGKYILVLLKHLCEFSKKTLNIALNDTFS